MCSTTALAAKQQRPQAQNCPAVAVASLVITKIEASLT